MTKINRNTLVQSLKNEKFDILVIGGGITGAGIALDAASRGLKTALIEKDDFASGTSSRSTKLVHGGLRYLAQFKVGLVREVGMERAVIHKLAPHLVIPEKMLLPLIQGGKFGKYSTSAGLKIYDWLAKVKGSDRRKMLSQIAALEKEPLLDKNSLKGAGYYSEYRTDDARLTIEVIKSAIRYGAVCANYCELVSFKYTNDKISAVVCRDIFEENEVFTIEALTVINAGGPWVDQIRKLDSAISGKQLHLTKGVHLVVDHSRFPLRQSIYFDTPDGRMIFAIPRNGKTYIGTTDTEFQGDLDHIHSDPEDANYILSAVNQAFPQVQLNSSDIEAAWAGLRPLIHEPGKTASEISRKDEIFISANGLITIAGGKLTGYRKMAEKTVNLAISKNNKAFGRIPLKTKTAKIPLCAESFSSLNEIARFKDKLNSQLSGLQIKEAQIASEYLVCNYGKQAESILSRIHEYHDPDINLNLIKAELDYCINEELCIGLDDFLDRRTGRIYFDRTNVEKYIPLLFRHLQTTQNYSKSKVIFLDQKLNKMLSRSSISY